MKKLLLSLVISLSICLCSAQEWSAHLKTTDMPVLVANGTHWGDLRVLPDAITSNTDNQNSIYSENSVFTAFCPSFFIDGPQTGFSWSAPGSEGAWIIGKDEVGATILSKRIHVAGHFLRIWSLQYNESVGDEMLVFTGSIVRNSDAANRLVVGTYNLVTNTVSMQVAYDPYIEVNNSIPQSSFVASQGIGVRKIESSTHNHFMAIGQSGDRWNAAHPAYPPMPGDRAKLSKAMWPLAVIFSVSTTGIVTVDHTERQDFLFKPTSVTNSYPRLGGNGTSIVAGGLHIYDALEPTFSAPQNDPNSCHHTYVAMGAYTFDAIPNGTSWDIKVDNGIHLRDVDYAHTGIGLKGPAVQVIMTNDVKREIILGATSTCKEVDANSGINLDGVGDPLLYRVDISGGNYSFLDGSRFEFPDVKYGTLERLVTQDNSGTFDVILSVTDPNSQSNEVNGSSIGFMTLPIHNISGSSSPIIRTIFTEDVLGTNDLYQREIRHSTALRVPTTSPGSDYRRYLVADGYQQSTVEGRAHFNSAPSLENFICESNFSPITHSSTPIDTQGGPFLRKHPTPMWTTGNSITVSDINSSIWECNSTAPTCNTQTSLNVSTGYNETTSSLIADHIKDDDWIITQVPAGLSSSLVGQAPYVVPKHTSYHWAGATSKYLNYKDSELGVTNWSVTTLPFIYQLGFCICGDFGQTYSAVFDLSFHCDDWGEVWLMDGNGNPIQQLITQSYVATNSHFTNPTDNSSLVPHYLAPGNYSLAIIKRNRTSYLGVSLDGSITCSALDADCSFTPVLNGTYNGTASFKMGFSGTSEANVSEGDLALENGYKIYPNPAGAIVTIVGIEIGAQVQIADMNGRIEINEAYGSDGIDVSKLGAGVYIVKIMDGNRFTNYDKLVIER